MASIPALSIEQSPELMVAVQAIIDHDPDLSPITGEGVKICLQQIARALHSTVTSLVTIRNSFVSETGTANVSFQRLEASVVELSSKTIEMTAKLATAVIPPDAKPFTPFVIKICETKSIANLKSFGEDRTGFRLWHDKLINAISQQVTGCRGLFAEMKTQ